MNKNIKLAVAGAVLALSATAANAGIVIPAGDWTVDIAVTLTCLLLGQSLQHLTLLLAVSLVNLQETHRKI